jgi:alkaline phosphatase
LAATALAAEAPSLRILLPERTRVLQGQQLDLVLEVRNAAAAGSLKVTAGEADYASRFDKAVAAQLDCDSSSDWVIRASLQSFTTPAKITLTADGWPVLGLFRASPGPRNSSSGIRANTDPNMDVAYDKLRFIRSASETTANAYGSTGVLGAFADQPMLDLMTQKAIEVLSSSFANKPFILMVEGASIDKQSHPNSYTGTIWDTIEFDKAVGVARAWAAKRKDTLVVVGAGHGQAMTIIGVNNTPDEEYFSSTKKEEVTYRTTRGEQSFTVCGDSYTNARAWLPVLNSSTGAENNRDQMYMPGTFTPKTAASDPYSDTFSAYFESPGYYMDSASGYPSNVAAHGKTLRRLAVGFRTGDHTGDRVPFTAEGTERSSSMATWTSPKSFSRWHR